jgi:hypothetical protein
VSGITSDHRSYSLVTDCVRYVCCRFSRCFHLFGGCKVGLAFGLSDFSEGVRLVLKGGQERDGGSVIIVRFIVGFLAVHKRFYWGLCYVVLCSSFRWFCFVNSE